jgi:hypothetical protein
MINATAQQKGLVTQTSLNILLDYGWISNCSDIEISFDLRVFVDLARS